MPDPQLDAFCRIGGPEQCRSDVFRRHQRYLRDEIQPKLDERDALIEENAALTSKVAELETALGKKAKKTPEAA